MEIKDEIKRLRESTGMNRKEFCEYFEIPYRTVTEWERGTRKMPDYVLRLLAYKVTYFFISHNVYHLYFGILPAVHSAPEDVKSLLQKICGFFATKMA